MLHESLSVELPHDPRKIISLQTAFKTSFVTLSTLIPLAAI